MSVRARGRMTRLLRRLGGDGEPRRYAFAQFDGDERLTPWYLPGGRELDGELPASYAQVKVRHVEGLGSPQAMEAGAWDFAREGDAPCQVTVTFSGGAQVPRDWPAERRASPSRVVVSETSTPPASSAQPDVDVALCATLVGEPPAQTAGVHGVTRPERRSGAAGGEEVLRDLRTPEPSEAPEGPPERPGGSHREPPETPPAESEIQRLRRLYPHADAGPGSELALLMGDTFDD